MHRKIAMQLTIRGRADDDPQKKRQAPPSFAGRIPAHKPADHSRNSGYAAPINPPIQFGSAMGL
jgi:hypothetical protein